MIRRGDLFRQPSDEWEFALTPLLWGAGIDGTVGLAGREADFEVSLRIC